MTLSLILLLFVLRSVFYTKSYTNKFLESLLWCTLNLIYLTPWFVCFVFFFFSWLSNRHTTVAFLMEPSAERGDVAQRGPLCLLRVGGRPGHREEGGARAAWIEVLQPSSRYLAPLLFIFWWVAFDCWLNFQKAPHFCKPHGPAPTFASYFL